MMIQTDSAVLLLGLLLVHSLFFPAESSSSSCPFSNPADEEGPAHSHDYAHDHDHTHHAHKHGHSHAHDHGHTHSHHDYAHHHHHDHVPTDSGQSSKHKLAEELAEEEELRLYGFKSDIHVNEHQHKHHHDHHQKPAVSSIGLWMQALGCSLLVSMASLVCLIILPLIVSHGKPSRIVVDFLAAFGAGAMLGDAFLHQLPHALGSSNSHSHSHAVEHGHHEEKGHSHDGGHGHAHSIQDLSVGLAVLAGIILFFLVEKIVRQVEKASSKGMVPWAAHHHHHHHQHENESLKHSNEEHEEMNGRPLEDDAKVKDASTTNADAFLEHEKSTRDKPYCRKKIADIQEESEDLKLLPERDEADKKQVLKLVDETVSPNLILGYLNLFSDGVHNFTDGMALGAAFLNHGTLGGWSRTLFLLAHELPQEVGDFGILVQSGFSVFKALAFNFLSALVALAGTVVALLLGGNPGHSSLIEGFTAGGFIYIAVAGVLPEMHQQGTSIKRTILQLLALSMGMCVALTISLVE